MNPVSPRIEILAIGDELLLGETVDTNAAWIAQRLAREGIATARKTTVGDDAAAIRDALTAALRRTRVVVCTGGLGPTRDDLTRDAVAGVYGREQHVDEGWLGVLRERYARRGIPMPEVNRVQALLPAGATLLHNDTGTAPGIAMDDDALGLTIMLPGVPSEMRGLMEAHVVPLLRDRLHAARPIRSRMLRTAGISEAALAERIDDIAQDIAQDIARNVAQDIAQDNARNVAHDAAQESAPDASALTLAFLPQVASVDLRLTCRGDAADGDAMLERAVTRLRERLGDDVYATDDTDLAVLVGRVLTERGLTLALAESCTGGLVSKRLSDASGASSFLLAGFVTYHNEAKREFLGVRTETLAMHGAVSEQCAREMAEGARRAIDADVAVAITGIAGPGGGSEDKPVGTVWYAVALKPDVARSLGRPAPVTARKFVHPGDRSDIRDRAAQTALDMLRRTLMVQPPVADEASDAQPDPADAQRRGHETDPAVPHPAVPQRPDPDPDPAVPSEADPANPQDHP